MHKAMESHWASDLENKPSLKYINPCILKVGKCHHIWVTVRNSVYDSRRAQLQCRLLTQELTSYRVTEPFLILKMPRKPASENIVCWCRLLNILANFSNLFLHTGKDCGPWSDCSQSDQGLHCLQKWLLKSQADDKAGDNCCDWQFKG